MVEINDRISQEFRHVFQHVVHDYLIDYFLYHGRSKILHYENGDKILVLKIQQGGENENYMINSRINFEFYLQKFQVEFHHKIPNIHLLGQYEIFNTEGNILSKGSLDANFPDVQVSANVFVLLDNQLQSLDLQNCYIKNNDYNRLFVNIHDEIEQQGYMKEFFDIDRIIKDLWKLCERNIHFDIHYLLTNTLSNLHVLHWFNSNASRNHFISKNDIKRRISSHTANTFTQHLFSRIFSMEDQFYKQVIVRSFMIKLFDVDQFNNTFVSVCPNNLKQLATLFSRNVQIVQADLTIGKCQKNYKEIYGTFVVNNLALYFGACKVQVGNVQEIGSLTFKLQLKVDFVYKKKTVLPKEQNRFTKEKINFSDVKVVIMYRYSTFHKIITRLGVDFTTTFRGCFYKTIDDIVENQLKWYIKAYVKEGLDQRLKHL